ncbi:zinc finger protein Xfin-like isoform X1 [Folsomia candida]|uniref:zinc finger protein Xfin-like isoform X1 n=1 Tax=Folsomia candida TaxID=158441 RepID=UPI00160536FA|nr:zinc finger protein Xfin-like isoform X1 [Folsomia candida]
MSKEHSFPNFTKKGTGHILQDLLSSTVLLQRSNFVPPTQPGDDYNFPQGDHSSPEVTSSCSICAESGTNLRALTVQEMEILAKFVPNQEQISLILQTENHPAILCCKICASATLFLAKRTTEIENITISLRAVISRGNGIIFNKGRNEAKINELSTCSICSESGTNQRPLAVQQMEILAKFVLNQEQISLILQTDDHLPIFCCKICSSAILSLAKLTTQIENITISLRAIISRRNGPFNKVRNESAEISESAHQVDNDDSHQLTGEEEFSVKVEPTYGDEITPDPPKSDHSDVDVANSHVPKYVCKICRPNAAFSCYHTYKRHMKNKNIHPDVSEANIADYQPHLESRKFVCKICKRKFLKKSHLERHMRSKNTHPDVSDPAFSLEQEFSVKVELTNDDGDEITSDPPYHPESDDYHSDVDVANSNVPKYVCKICHPNATFPRWDTYKRHMKNKKIHPDVSEADIAAYQPHLESRKFACKICNKKFLKNAHLLRHLTSKTIHPDVSDADFAAAFKTTIERKRPVVPRKRKPFPCPKCDKSFNSSGGLLHHTRLSHEWLRFQRKCTFCTKVFINSTSLQRHMHTRHNVPIPEEETRHFCAICAKTLSSLTSKQCHVEKVHFPDKTSCPYGCEVKIDSEADWVTHLEGCDSEKMNAESESVCKYCPAVFRNLLLQIEHRLRVHPANSLSCSTCGQRFTLQSALTDHPCTKTATTSQNSGPDVVDPGAKYVAGTIIVSEFIQQVVPDEGSSPPNICNNVDLHQLPEEEEELKIEQIYENDDSDQITSDPLYDPERGQSDYESDVDVANSHVPKYLCKICQPNVTFTSFDAYKRHMKNTNIHPDVSDADITDFQTRKFACKICKRKFAKNSNLLRHLTNKKIHPDISDADFAAAFRTTKRVVPPPKPVFEPAHLCPKCGQRFTLQSVLSRHLCSAKTGTNSGPEFESDFTVQPDVTLNGHVRNENINADISELSSHAAPDEGSPPLSDQISNNDADQQLIEEFSVKVYPISDDPADPLKISESEDDDVAPVANPGVPAEPKYVCKICQPNVAFDRHRNYKRHMTNKNIHPDISSADIARFHPHLELKQYACQLCPKKFAGHCHLLRHLSSTTIHPDISDADFAERLLSLHEKPLPCPKCDQSFPSYLTFRQHFFRSHEWLPYRRKCTLCPKVFSKLTLLQGHMFARHNIPIPAGARQEARHSCPMCAKTFSGLTTKQRHVELVHLPDKTSCPYGCETKIDSEADWVTHLERCDSPKMSAESECACKYCPAMFRNLLLEMEHRLRVHPENTRPCLSCGKRFIHHTVLHNHRCSKNGPVPKSGLGVTPDSKDGAASQVSGSFHKIEPIDDPEETTSDPLYHPESDDDDANSEPHAGSKKYRFTCKMCKRKFTKNDHLIRHMKNKNIHPDISAADVSDRQPHLSSSAKFVCKICNKEFAKNCHLLRHLRNKRIHPDLSEADISVEFTVVPPPLASKKFACKICGTKFTKNQQLLRHLRNKKIHPDISDADFLAASTGGDRSVPQPQKLFPCPNCDKRYFSSRDLDHHKRHAHEWVPFRRKCTLCPVTFTKLILLQRHMQKCHDVPIPRQENSCTICSKTFVKSESKNSHVELVHSPDKTSCPYGCEVKIDSEDEWVTHLEGCDSPKMSAESECVCKYCPAVFRNILLQIEHRFRIHPANTYSCPTCTQRFTCKAVLNQHHCTLIGNIGSTANIGNVPKNSEKQKFLCTICQPNVSFNTSGAHVRHMRDKNIHPDSADAHVSQVKPRLKSRKFPCKKCGIKFSRSNHLVRHMMNKNLHPDVVSPGSKISAGSTRETGCDQKARIPRSLPGGTKRKCTRCPRQFAHVTLLQKHMQQWHNLSMPNNLSRPRYPCEVCAKTFAKKAHLLLHVELVHFSDKTSCPYGCEVKID